MHFHHLIHYEFHFHLTLLFLVLSPIMKQESNGEHMNDLKAIIFDIDLTLLNTLDMNMRTLMKIVEEETGEQWSFDQILKYASYPGMKVMQEFQFKNPELVYARWVKYVNEYALGAVPYEGVEEMLTILKQQYRLAVVSAKKQAQYEIDMGRYGFDAYIDVTVLADDTEKHKPDPEPLLLCLQRLQLQAHEVLYIGDAPTDDASAHQAQIAFGYASWGSLSQDGIDHARYIFASPWDVIAQLTKED